MKTYERDGLKFRFSELPKESEDGVIYLRSEEWDWIKSRKDIGVDEWRILYLLRLEDCRNPLIPEEEKIRKSKVSDHYAEEIKSMLLGCKK